MGAADRREFNMIRKMLCGVGAMGLNLAAATVAWYAP